MGLFRRKGKVDKVEINADSVNITDSTSIKNPADPIVEIIANEDAKKEVIDEAVSTSNKLNELLVQNGFTIKIYLAAHNPPTKKKG